MEAIHWVIAYLFLAAIVSLVASKKGRKGWLFFLIMLVLPIPLMIWISYSLGDSMDKKPLAMWIAAFSCPLVGFIVAVMSDSASEVAAETGSYGGYKKCPFCAESVRKEATKCKHCHSMLEGPPPTS